MENELRDVVKELSQAKREMDDLHRSHKQRTSRDWEELLIFGTPFNNN